MNFWSNFFVSEFISIMMHIDKTIVVELEILISLY